jgi:hypothetical protein
MLVEITEGSEEAIALKLIERGEDPTAERIMEVKAEFDEAAKPPLLLVRVQDDLYNASMEERGLFLPYAREGISGVWRNTSHWTVNCVVSDHAYGRFNEAADGSLKGKIVILADPREMPVPAGLGQVDTWFRLDAERHPGGPLRRGLSVGHRAIVVAPEGYPVPDGVSVVRYAGGIEARNGAVERVLAERSIKPEVAGMWGWVGGKEAGQWASDVGESLYRERARAIHFGPHDGSVDGYLEAGARVEALLERFENDRLYVEDSGAEVPILDIIERAIAEQRDLLAGVLASFPEVELSRTGDFYLAQRDAVDRLDERARSIAESWDRRLAFAQADAAHDGMSQILPPPLPSQLPPGVAPPPLPPFAGQVVQQTGWSVSDEEIFGILAGLGEDFTTERVEEIRMRLADPSFPVHQGVFDAVIAASKPEVRADSVADGRAQGGSIAAVPVSRPSDASPLPFDF